MTRNQRQAYSERHVRRTKLFERKYLKQVYDAVYAQILVFTAILKKDGLDEAKRSMDRVVINDKIASVIMELYTEVGVYQANKVLREINSSAKAFSHKQLVLVTEAGVSTPSLFLETKAGFGFNEEWLRAIINYFKDYLLDKAVVPITQTTIKQILGVLTEGQEAGWGIDRIVRELESSELTLWRAKLIVRTELVKAYSKGHELGKEKSKWETEDTWIAGDDIRTRTSHHEVDGDKIGEGGRFKVPVYKKVGKVNVQIGFDLMSGPGDPRASIGNLANCRCTKVTRARRDENGRLIPKQQRLMIL